MAKVTTNDAPEKGAPRLIHRAELPEVTLPTKPTKGSSLLDDYSILIHGEKKIGKTTMAMQGGKVLLLQCDPPQKAYKRLEIQIPNWPTFLAALKLLERAARRRKYPYDRVVLDGADTWFNLAQDYACKQLGIEHPEEAPWGKGWGKVRSVFTDGLRRFLCLPKGRWLLCHSVWRETELHTGAKIDKLVPRLSGMADEIVNGFVDAWFAYVYHGEERRLILRGDERVAAGHRIDTAGNHHFRSTDDNRLRTIRLGTSPKQSFESLSEAFLNRYRVSQKRRPSGRRST